MNEPISDAVAPATRVVVRPASERVVQTVLFELTALVVAVPAYTLFWGSSAAESSVVLTLLATAVALWTAVHNHLFDLAEARIAQRVASDRPVGLRVLHAISHEVSAALVSLPVLMLVGGLDWREAAITDVGLSVAYGGYALAFHAIYDALRPVQLPECSPTTTGGGTMHIIQHQRAHDTMRFGVHLMIDGYMADPGALDDEAKLTSLLENLPEELGMHRICDPVVVPAGPNCIKDPGGLSGFVMIAESHISIHTFPARRFVTIDLYTCQDDLDVVGVSARFGEVFQIENADVYVQNRGMRYPAENLVGVDANELSLGLAAN